MAPSKPFRLGWRQTPKFLGTSFHDCGYTAIVYRVAEAVVQLYTAGKFAELAKLHNQLAKYTIRERRDNALYLIPSFLIRLMCVLLCFIKLIFGNRYGPRASSCQRTLENLGCVSLAGGVESSVIDCTACHGSHSTLCGSRRIRKGITT